MKKCLFFFFYIISCRTFLSAELADLNSSKKFLHAERLKAEGHYEDALHYYFFMDEHFETTPELCQSMHLSQAHCLLELHQPELAIDLLTQDSNPHSPYQNYLIGLAYRQQKNYQLALNILNTIDSNRDTALGDKINFEKGINYFYLGKSKDSAFFLKKIEWSPFEPTMYYLSKLYLIRMALLNKETSSAKASLLHLHDKLPDTHPLHFEKNYLEGMMYFQDGKYQEAITYLQKVNFTSNSYQKKVQAHLVKCFFKLAEKATDQAEVVDFLTQAEAILKNTSDEIKNLLLCDFYLLKAARLSDPNAYQQAKEILKNLATFNTEEGQRQAKLKLANAAPCRVERIEQYNKLIQDAQSDLILQADAWYLKGLNELEEGQIQCLSISSLPLSNIYFEEAALSFKHAHQLYLNIQPQSAGDALKNQILANFYQSDDSKKKQAFKLLTALTKNGSDSGQLLILAGLIVTSIKNPDSEDLLNAKTLLKTSPNFDQKTNEKILKLQGILLTKENDWKAAYNHFSDFFKYYPHSIEIGEILFWMADCCSHLNNEQVRQEHLRTLYLNYPQSPFAAPAYFNLFSYREYMQGQRQSIKHLEAMPELFSESPYVISAYYLIGLDHLKNHMTYNGKTHRRKDEIAAIAAFQAAESKFDELFEKKKLTPIDTIYYIHIKYQAMLERASANLAIADQSTSTKKMIYLEYTEDVFKELIQVFHDPNPLIQTTLLKDQSYPKILQEAEFGLAQTYTRRNKIDEAYQLFDQLTQKAQQNITENNYLLAKAYYEKGVLSQKKYNYSQALNDFLQAEEVNHAFNFLSPDEKLDLWIQQSQCYKELGQLEEAMLLLSKVINDEAISSLRVKAMYLRADIYTQQGRPELALKQLDATSKKGGEWSKKAKEKMEKDYAY
ncbi:tetratricopeptide repeat protein [Candidatus Protochlamydia amoebophila]|uniref:Uncharacterized protein n=1 Tax=Protochlamydia amoebophila (strain UWE25) TaxID=264201 RepID=Q6MAX9_PARUW|nr:tetratricopeptide repeat protein [Candidatus Protochlamydia amoebophila]CAF24270.1 unnamed protein product [Candidatus Protochlamydia amoebophila UWE25]